MKIFIILSILLSSCGTFGLKIAADFLDGECKTTERILLDLTQSDPLQESKKDPVMKMPGK